MKREYHHPSHCPRPVQLPGRERAWDRQAKRARALLQGQAATGAAAQYRHRTSAGPPHAWGQDGSSSAHSRMRLPERGAETGRRPDKGRRAGLCRARDTARGAPTGLGHTAVTGWEHTAPPWGTGWRPPGRAGTPARCRRQTARTCHSRQHLHRWQTSAAVIRAGHSSVGSHPCWPPWPRGTLHSEWGAGPGGREAAAGLQCGQSANSRWPVASPAAGRFAVRTGAGWAAGSWSVAARATAPLRVRWQ